MLRNASSIGLNVARVYAHTTDPEHPFQVQQANKNEGAISSPLSPTTKSPWTSLASIALNKLSKWLILASCKAYLEASKGVLLFLQTSPGSFNNDALEAMDFVMETARKLGMKVMLSFADNWKFQGTILLTICILPPGHSEQFLMTHFNMIGIFPIWTKSC